MSHINRIAGIVALGLVLLAAGPAVAQTQGGHTNQMQSSTQSSPEFSSQQLHDFADAAAEVRDIRQSAVQKIQQAGSDQEQVRVRKQTRRDMLEAIKESGLTLMEYNQIARAARSNPELVKKIRQMQ